MSYIHIMLHVIWCYLSIYFIIFLPMLVMLRSSINISQVALLPIHRPTTIQQHPPWKEDSYFRKKKPPAPPKNNIWICRLQGDFCVEIPSVLLIFRVTVTKLTDLNPWSIENRPLLVLHWRRHNLAPDKHVSMKDSSNRPLRTGKQKEQLFEDILFYSSFKRESLIVNIWLNHPITYSNYSGPKGYDSDMTIPDRYCISSTWSTGVDKRQL